MDAIREETSLNADIGEGYKSALLCHLGNIAYRTRKTVSLDSKDGRIAGDPEAAKLWGRAYEEGWAPTV